MELYVKRILTGVTVVGSLFLLNSCGIFSKKEVVVPPPPEFPVVSLKKGDAVTYTDFATEIESQKMVEIRSRANGYITKIYVKEGSKVRKGEPILQIDPSEYNQRVNAAEAAVKAAYAAVSNAELEVKKLTPLVAENIVSSFQLDAAQSNLAAARAQLAQAQAQHQDAKIQLSYTSISAPVEGVIGKVDVYPGSLLSSGSLVTTVSEKGDVFAYFAFDEKKIFEVMNTVEGKDIYAKVANLPEVELVMADGTVYGHKGRLEIASGIINSATGSTKLKGIFPNPDMVIRAGSTGKVRIPSYFKNLMLVPQRATFELQDKRQVYLFNPADSTLTSRTVTVVSQTDDSYIVTDGVKEGDMIVYEGTDKVREGMKITPQTIALP